MVKLRFWGLWSRTRADHQERLQVLSFLQSCLAPSSLVDVNRDRDWGRPYAIVSSRLDYCNISLAVTSEMRCAQTSAGEKFTAMRGNQFVCTWSLTDETDVVNQTPLAADSTESYDVRRNYFFQTASGYRTSLPLRSHSSHCTWSDTSVAKIT